MKKIVYVVCLMLLGAGAAPTYAGQVLTLKDAVSKGLKENPSIQAAREALSASDYSIKASKAAFGPAMSTQYGYTRLDQTPYSFGYQAGIRNNWSLQFNVHQPLFTGFNLLTTYEKSVLANEQAASQINHVELQLVGAIQDTFLQLMQAREQVRSAEDSLTRLKAHLKVNRSFYEVGLRPKLDVLQAEVNVADAEQALVAAQNGVDTLKAQINTLLGMQADAEVDYEGSLNFFPFSLTLKECLERAEKNRPDLRIADLSVRLAEKETTLAKVPFYPQIAADFNYAREGDGAFVDGGTYHTPSAWNAQVGLSWTFFEWGKTYYTVQQAKKNESRLMQEYANLRNQSSLEVKQSYLSIKEAEKRIVAAKQGLAAAKESYRMAQARYEAQVGTNTDVLDAMAAQTKSEYSVTAALADYERAVVALHLAVGEKEPPLPVQ